MNDDLVLEHILNPSAPLGQAVTITEEKFEVTTLSEEEKEAKSLELAGIKLAEGNNLVEAKDKFNHAIRLAPNLSSLYNNRAQVLRLLLDNENALIDINKAIELSKGVGKTAVQAYTQRAMLYMLGNNEEAARKDFEKAAQLGGKFASCQAAKLNPYAKLCNQMLEQAINQLQ